MPVHAVVVIIGNGVAVSRDAALLFRQNLSGEREFVRIVKRKKWCDLLQCVGYTSQVVARAEQLPAD